MDGLDNAIAETVERLDQCLDERAKRQRGSASTDHVRSVEAARRMSRRYRKATVYQTSRALTTGLVKLRLNILIATPSDAVRDIGVRHLPWLPHSVAAGRSWPGAHPVITGFASPIPREGTKKRDGMR